MMGKKRGGEDAHEFHTELADLLLSADVLEEIIEPAVDVIQQHFAVRFCLIYLKHSTWRKAKVFGDTMAVDQTELDSLLAHSQLHTKLQRSPRLQDVTNKALLRGLHQAGIAALGNLDNPTHDFQGFIILGSRLDGKPFTAAQQTTITDISTTIGLAVQRAVNYGAAMHAADILRERLAKESRQLRQAKHRLQTIEQTKDDFISMASHQLRTPLTSVKGYVSMVLDGDAGELNETQTKLLNQAFISSQRMVYLIADLLNVSRLRSGKFIIEKIPSDLNKAIGEEVQQLVSTAESRGLTLEYIHPETFPIYELDEMKLRQVVMNFVDNAIYYTPSGGKIKVTLTEKPDSIECVVKDTGMGVPASEQHRLFTKFFRAGNAQKARPDGTGLGLYMAKKAVIAHGGAIIFKSKEGKGSNFGFTIPKSELKKPG